MLPPLSCRKVHRPNVECICISGYLRNWWIKSLTFPDDWPDYPWSPRCLLCVTVIHPPLRMALLLTSRVLNSMLSTLACWTEAKVSVQDEIIGTSIQRLKKQEIWGNFPEKIHSSNSQWCWRPLNPGHLCPLISGATLQSQVTHFLSSSFYFLGQEYLKHGHE